MFPKLQTPQNPQAGWFNPFGKNASFPAEAVVLANGIVFPAEAMRLVGQTVTIGERRQRIAREHSSDAVALPIAPPQTARRVQGGAAYREQPLPSSGDRQLHPGLASSLQAAVVKAWRICRTTWNVTMAKRALETWSDRALHDIGISHRSEIERFVRNGREG